MTKRLFRPLNTYGLLLIAFCTGVALTAVLMTL